MLIILFLFACGKNRLAEHQEEQQEAYPEMIHLNIVTKIPDKI